MRSSSQEVSHHSRALYAVDHALELPDVRFEIAKHCDRKTLRVLAQVDTLFRAAAQQPQILGKCYAPSTINVSTRTVSTSWRPVCSGGIQDLSWSTRATLPRVIEVFKGKPWTLQFQRPITHIYSSTTLRILDAVVDMGVGGFKELKTFTSFGSTYKHARRQCAYAFMQDRIFRLDHQILIPTRKNMNFSSLMIEMGAAASFFLLFTWSALEMYHWPPKDSPYVPEKVSSLVFLSSLQIFTGLAMFTLADSVFRDLLVVPINHQRLNLWAQQIQRLEQAGEASKSFGKRAKAADTVFWS